MLSPKGILVAAYHADSALEGQALLGGVGVLEGDPRGVPATKEQRCFEVDPIDPAVDVVCVLQGALVERRRVVLAILGR